MHPILDYAIKLAIGFYLSCAFAADQGKPVLAEQNCGPLLSSSSIETNISKRNQWTRDLLIKVARLLSANFDDLNPGNLMKNNLKVRSLVIEHLRMDVSFRTIQNEMSKEFGSWVAGLKASGVNTSSLQVQARDIVWSKKFLIEIMQFLYPHFSDDMRKDRLIGEHEKVRKLLREHLGYALSIFTIEKKINQEFGSWFAGLEAAKVNTETIQRKTVRVDWNKDLIIAMLRELNKHFTKLSITELKNNDAKFRDVIYKRFNLHIASLTFREAVLAHFPTWYLALLEAKVKTAEVRSRVLNINWTRPLIEDILHYLSQKRINLNVGPFISNVTRVKQLTAERYTKPLSPWSIHYAALALYGSWPAAREAAGVPAKFTPRKKVTSDLVIMPHVVMWEKNADGTSRRVVQYGEASKTPEEELIESQQHQAVHALKENLEHEETVAIDALLEYLDSHGGLEDQEMVLAFLKENTHRDWSWPMVNELFKKMSTQLDMFRDSI